MDKTFLEVMEDNPVIAAVKDMDGLEQCLKSECRVVFILFGDVCGIPGIVKKIQDAGRIALVHIDLVGGLSTKEISVDYIKEQAKADGIISTKQNLIRRAKELSMYTVMRFFAIDSMAVNNIESQWKSVRPDFIEMLPGVMPKVIRRLTQTVPVPLIAGGLIEGKEDIVAALSAGAVSVSSTNRAVWFM